MYSSKAVGSIFLVAAAGAMLVRLKIISHESLRVLSQLVFFIMLPCLLFTKVAASVNLHQLAEYWIFPVSCVIYVVIGILIGMLAVKICHPRKEIKNGVIAAIAFANTGYLPIPVLVAVTIIFPCFAGNENAGDEAVALISVFLMGFSPLLWTVGYSLISGHKICEVGIKKIFTPPIIGMLLGIAVGLCPPLKKVICDSSGHLNFLFNSASVIAQGTIPCALLLLGGLLANGPVTGTVNKRSIFTVILTKLIIFPIIGILYVIMLRKLGFLPANLMAALVLVVEAGSPPANNLVVMAALSNHEMEQGLASIMFWSYLSSIFTLTLVIMTTMWVFG